MDKIEKKKIVSRYLENSANVKKNKERGGNSWGNRESKMEVFVRKLEDD